MHSFGAYIFDLNGTLVDDMQYHVTAWHRLLNDKLGARLTEEEVKRQMYGKNSEVMARIFGQDHFTTEEADRLSFEKEKKYQEAFLPHLKLIAGLDAFLESSYRRGIPMAIGSAAIPFNIDFVLDHLHLRHYFPVIVSADDVRHSKPDPETYLKSAAGLNIKPEACLVFEDAPKGVEAALHAGMWAVALTTMHDEGEFAAYGNVLCCIHDYTDPALAQAFL